jgi:hypothetical protein
MTDNKNTSHSAASLVELGADVFLIEKQLAGRHKRSPKTLRNDRVAGVYIPFHIIGRQVRYRLKDVLDYELAHRVACGVEGTGIVAPFIIDPRTETFLTPGELANRHQRQEKTLRNDRVHRRYISFYKLEGQVRYALSDILAYEHAHRATSTTSAQAREGKRDAPSRLNRLQEDRPNDL